MDDGALLERYARHADQDAFRALVGRHLNFVYSAALRQVGGDAQFAQDVAQSVFTDLARKAAALTGHPVITGWLFTSTRFAAAKLVRRERLRQAREEKAHVMQHSLGPEARTPRWEDLRPVLDATLADLKAVDRDAVLLRFFEQRPFAEIGAALQLSEDAARMRVERALERLRVLLARRGVTSTAAALGAVLTTQATAAAPAGLGASITSAAFASAAAGGAAAGALGFLNVMSTTKITVAAAGLVALLAVGTIVHETNVTRASAASVETARRERELLQARLARSEQRARQLDDQLAAARASAAPPTGSATSTATVEQAPAVVAAIAASRRTTLDHALEDPAARAAFVDHEVLRARAQFERFFRQAGLSPERQDQFVKNLREFAEGKLDFMAAIRTHGYNWENQPVDATTVGQTGRLDKQITAELQTSMRALLGAEGFRQYQDYTRGLPIRNVVDDLAARLYDTASPLTAAQAEQLTAILRETPFRTPSPEFRGNTVAGTFIALGTYNAAKTKLNFQGGSTLTDWREPVADAAVARAATVLAPTQVAALRQMQERQAAQLLATPTLTSPANPRPVGGK